MPTISQGQHRGQQRRPAAPTGRWAPFSQLRDFAGWPGLAPIGSDLKDDLELMIKSELMGAVGNFETRLDRIEKQIGVANGSTH
jgi:hypothetical protein